MAFGFSASFFVFYVNGSIVNGPGGVGTEYIGSLTAILAATAALSSLLFARVGSDRMLGKGAVLAFGSGCFGTIGACFMLLPAASFNSLHTLVPLYMLQGIPMPNRSIDC
jgi:hypothetical protein